MNTAGLPTAYEHGNRLTPPGSTVDPILVEIVQGTFDDLTNRAAKALDAEGFPRPAHRYSRTVDLRYFGQAFEVRVAAPDGTVDDAYAAAVADAFHAEHRALYGYDFRHDPTQQVEWVNLRVTGVGPITRPVLRDLPARDSGSPTRESLSDLPGDDRADRSKTPVRGRREVCFDADDGPVDTPVLWRPDLRAGDTFSGPAIVEEFGSTVPVHPGFSVRVDAIGNLVITRGTADLTATGGDR